MALRIKPGPDRSELAKVVRRSVEAYEAMSPEQRRESYEVQRRSWCVGESMLENLNMTREEANALYDRAILKL